MVQERQLLQVWERAYASSSVERVVHLSALACPALSVEEILDLPIGVRDGRLIALRQSLFGDQVESTVTCSACSSKLELSFDLTPMTEAARAVSDTTFTSNWKSSTVMLRCPTTRDVLLIDRTDADSAPNLIRQCIIDCADDIALDCVQDESFRRAFTESIQQRDPLGLIEFNMTCSECRAAFTTVFDISRFLWTELDAWCRKLMTDIHSLARAYGWTESEVLNLGPWRRQVYLNMVRQ
ncbi:MAG: hypothetical protein U0892_04280 [Pirellulales bacterium]